MSDFTQRSAAVHPPVLIVPGIGDSGRDHWQSRWQARNESYQRAQQRDWDHPVCVEWLQSLETSARRSGPNPVLAAHSLGCLLVVHWLAQTSVKVGGALLVAVPDPDGANFPTEARGFSPLPRKRFPCPSIVVASLDDPYGSLEFAKQCADEWGSRFVNIGNAGHINAESGLGDWREGYRLLQELLATSAG